MKSVEDYMNLREQEGHLQEPSGATEFTDPTSNPDAYNDNQGGDITGGGRVQNYPVSAANIRWIREQGGAFSFGYLGGFSLSDLTKILLGSDLSASVIKDADTEYDTLGDRQVEEQNAAIAYFDGEYQTIRAGYQAQYNAAIAAENFVSANVYVDLLLNGPHVQEYDRLTAIYTATAAERSALLSRMSDYIITGKINNSDPYGLDHPELAGQNPPKKKKKPGDPGYDPEVDGPGPNIERLKELIDKASKDPNSLTAAERQELIDAGLDDFAKGGETASPLGDLGLLGLTFGLVKGAFALGLGALTKLGLLGTAKAVGDQAVDTFVKDADSAGDYNKQLAGKLVSSILSGQPQEIKLSDAAAADQIKNIDPNQFADALTVGGNAPKPSSNSTVNPKNKAKILTGEWGSQGGSTVHYDPKTDTLTITSEKMLRTGQPGDKFDDTGKQTAFGDIPEPSDEQVSDITKQLMTGPLEPLMQGFGGIAQVVSGGGAATWDQIKSDPILLKTFSDNIGKLANDLAKGGVQGTASNVVAVRKVLTNLGFPQSEVEKTGGGFGQVYSQTSYSGSDIPPELRGILNKKSGNKSESKSYTTSIVLTESRKKVLKNIKKPVEVPELPKKYKMNFSGKYSPQNTPDQTASEITDALVASGNAKGQKWRLKDKAWQGYETSERMNVVYDKVGHGDQAWDMIVKENEKKKKDRELQEKLNIVAHEKALMKENPNYKTPFNQNFIDEQETLDADNDPLFKKVSKTLKKNIDYSKKPARKGYPNDPPPMMVNGRHPDLVANKDKVSNYYNRLDPVSAKAMPKTDNDSIDKKVDLAKNGKYPKDSPAASTAAKRHGLDKLRSKKKVNSKIKERYSVKKAKQIALKEQQYLSYFIENVVPKHYDWRTGQFSKTPLTEIKGTVLKRLEEIDNALSEGMKMKHFNYLYGGEIGSMITSINPTLVSSTFAQDLISASGEVTSHMFGPDFPGSHINSIGDFDKPESLSKVDAQATASWNSIQDVTPSGWTPENSYEYVSSASDVVSPGLETDTFKDTHFGEVTVSGDTISLSTGDDEDDTQYNTVDIADLNSLFPGVTFPLSIETPWDPGDRSPSEASMILRTFKSVSVGDKVSFDYSFTTLETEEDSDTVNYRGANRQIAGDDVIDDDYGFVLVGNTVQKIVSVLAKDGNNSDFNFGQDGEGLYKPDILQSRFPLTGKFSYTVKQSDIDNHGNLKFFIGVMDGGSEGAGTLESNLDITNLSFNGTKAAAGQLGRTTDAYNLGASVAALSPEFKNKRFKDKLKKRNKSADSKLSDPPGTMYDWKGNKIQNPENWRGGSMYDSEGQLVKIINYAGEVQNKQDAVKLMKTKQKAVANNSEVANAVEKLGTQAKVFRDYLTGNLPDTIDNDYLGQEYVNSIFKNAEINNQGTISVGDNIVGTGGEATYDPKTDQVTIPFNYDFKTNDQEFSDPSKAGRTNAFSRAVLNALGPYSADAQPNISLGDPLTSATQTLAGAVFGVAINTSKALGAGKGKKGKVTMSAAELEKTNPTLHAQIVGFGKKLKEELYPGQPSPNGFPDTPPPKLAPNGYHPEFGKRSNRYRRLDPVSAVVMNKVGTDDPETNKQVAAAAKKPKVKTNKTGKV